MLDDAKLTRELCERVAEMKALLDENKVQARQMLRKLLAGSKIEMEGSVRAASATSSAAS